MLHIKKNRSHNKVHASATCQEEVSAFGGSWKKRETSASHSQQDRVAVFRALGRLATLALAVTVCSVEAFHNYNFGQR